MTSFGLALTRSRLRAARLIVEGFHDLYPIRIEDVHLPNR
jgi:hypothetical protein